MNGQDAPPLTAFACQIVEAYQGGESVADIAERLGVGRSLVRRALETAGVVVLVHIPVPRQPPRRPRPPAASDRANRARAAANRNRALAASARAVVVAQERLDRDSDKLPEGYVMALRLRIAHPEASLRELADLANTGRDTFAAALRRALGRS